MKTDNNTVIGFVLIGILFIGYFWFSNQQQQVIMAEKKRTEDSIARIKTNIPVTKAAVEVPDTSKKENLVNNIAAGSFKNAANGTEQLTEIDNGLIKIIFTNKGAQPKSIELKKFKSFDSSNAIMAGSPNNLVSYTINTTPNQSVLTNSLYFP